MQPIVITSDVSMWALRPMFWLMDRYWPGHPRFLIGGYTEPDFSVDATWYSIGKFSDYPVDKWSDGLIDFLNVISDELVLFMMDDYWLNHVVNDTAIREITEYMQADPNVARFDLTGDRLGAANWETVGIIAGQEVIKSDPESPYHFSFQAALWRRSVLLDCLRPNESPWSAEINGDNRLRRLGCKVYGCSTPPMRYTIAMQQGHFSAADGGYQGVEYALPIEDYTHIVERRWIPDQIKK